MKKHCLNNKKFNHTLKINAIDTYNTIVASTEATLYKEKGSKFFGYCFPFHSENELKPIIDNLKKQHFGAGHFCYAYKIGINSFRYRTNDDGEPSNTAGMPIYGQIQSFSLTNVLLVVVRYFGGTKLGVGGLIGAYRTTAQISLKEAKVIQKTVDVIFEIKFDYKNINKVMRIVKEKYLEVISQKMETGCELKIKTPKKNTELIFNVFNDLPEINIKIVD